MNKVIDSVINEGDDCFRLYDPHFITQDYWQSCL